MNDQEVHAMAASDPRPAGRLLLVEDEDLLRWSVQRFLERRGYAVEAVADGAVALERLGSGRYDVVVTDLAVGGVDGLALAAEARSRHLDTQVIIITGRGSKDTVIEALRRGVFDYVEKPFALEELLASIVRALEKTRVMRELVHLSRTDGLTGLYNQRRFFEVLEAEMGRARRQGNPLGLLLVDVDDFKGYNDRYGHLAGDAALTRIAGCLRRACRRDNDGAYRYGGDEFILVLPEADASATARVAARLTSLIAAEGIALTVSIGTAQLRDGQDLKSFVREADAAMYRDKRADADAGAGAAG
jgi:diguanylate cyclase (GGDEF)-like protein